MARNTKAQALVTRDTIIEVAERLIETNGLSRTTLQDVAEAAGVTRGAIYWHFQNKSALFDSIMERAFVPFENALLLLNSQAIEPPPGKTERTRDLHFQVHVE
jgi:TetR/AcrR family acrAB operon transcriptional repressor